VAWGTWFRARLRRRRGVAAAPPGANAHTELPRRLGDAEARWGIVRSCRTSGPSSGVVPRLRMNTPIPALSEDLGDPRRMRAHRAIGHHALVTAVALTSQQSRFWRFRWRTSTVLLLSTWLAVCCVGVVAIWFRSWQGDMACPGPTPSEIGESHWSYGQLGHYCTYPYGEGQATEPAASGRVWLATVVAGGFVVALSLVSCVSPPRRTPRSRRPGLREGAEPPAPRGASAVP
jgi:hypothetical protein